MHFEGQNSHPSKLTGFRVFCKTLFFAEQDNCSLRKCRCSPGFLTTRSCELEPSGNRKKTEKMLRGRKSLRRNAGNLPFCDYLESSCGRAEERSPSFTFLERKMDSIDSDVVNVALPEGGLTF
ncbi:MAG TPA: hypothetical protein VLI91_01050, partial [Roseiarcus sp.]|nr:hypothetical protein [Roseiarcus sp.]